MKACEFTGNDQSNFVLLNTCHSTYKKGLWLENVVHLNLWFYAATSKTLHL